MNFTLINNFNNIKYEYYLKQPKSLLEWRSFEILAKNSKLIEAFDRNVSHPLIREHSHIDPVEN